jgi:hypothetical protein
VRRTSLWTLERWEERRCVGRRQEARKEGKKKCFGCDACLLSDNEEISHLHDQNA